MSNTMNIQPRSDKTPNSLCLFAWMDEWIDLQVLATIAPVVAVVGLLQPLNAYVFIGDGILQGSQDFVFEVRRTPSPLSLRVPGPTPACPGPVPT